MKRFDPLQLLVPLVQAPMAGVSTPLLSAAVCEAGGLGSIGVGAVDAACAHTMIGEIRARTASPFNVNVFVHATPLSDESRERAWIDALSPTFAEFNAEPPAALRTIYKSFIGDRDMLAMLLDTKPPVVSFHFGVPAADVISAFHDRGIYLMATATSLDEARAIEAAGIDAVVTQGIEAGGHRGIFDVDAEDGRLSTSVLTRLVVRGVDVPVIAAGGIMDGAGIAAALALGSVAAQLGTAFIACPESAADAAYREAIGGPGAGQTVMTRLISGRPARALANRFTALADQVHGAHPPPYPIAYDAGKALNAAAKIKGEHGFGAHWAGQGASLARALPAADLVAQLREELDAARASQATNSATWRVAQPEGRSSPSRRSR